MKYPIGNTPVDIGAVSTLVVEWIEISINEFHLRPVQVSTLVVEWIEITDMKEDFVEPLVSTLVVEWIEIYGISPLSHISWVSTLVVEWIEITWAGAMDARSRRSPPSWWSGLKSSSMSDVGKQAMSPPSWWSGLKSPGGYRNGIQS